MMLSWLTSFRSPRRPRSFSHSFAAPTHTTDFDGSSLDRGLVAYSQSVAGVETLDVHGYPLTARVVTNGTARTTIVSIVGPKNVSTVTLPGEPLNPESNLEYYKAPADPGSDAILVYLKKSRIPALLVFNESTGTLRFVSSDATVVYVDASSEISAAAAAPMQIDELSWIGDPDDNLALVHLDDCAGGTGSFAYVHMTGPGERERFRSAVPVGTVVRVNDATPARTLVASADPSSCRART